MHSVFRIHLKANPTCYNVYFVSQWCSQVGHLVTDHDPLAVLNTLLLDT